MGSLVGDMPDLTEDLSYVRTVAGSADGRKAENIVALQVAQVTTLTSYMVFVTGNSRPQNQAIAAAIMDDMEEQYGMIKNPQGTADSGWMILDYGSVMVHIMTPKSRLYYNVEGQVSVVNAMFDIVLSHSSSRFSNTHSGVKREAWRLIYRTSWCPTSWKNSSTGKEAIQWRV